MSEGFKVKFENVTVASGYSTGYNEGYDKGEKDGYAQGNAEGYESGYGEAAAKVEEIEIYNEGVYLPSPDKIGFSKVTVFQDIEEKNIDFIDYDGTLLYSYTVEEAKALTGLPPLPTNKGLVCTGWNWTLEDLLSVIDDFESQKIPIQKITIGALYTTDDGATRFNFSIPIDNYTISFVFNHAQRNTTTIDWGDGSAPEIPPNYENSLSDVLATHTYTLAGDYTVSVIPKSTSLRFGNFLSSTNQGNMFQSNSVRGTTSMLKSINMGDNATFFDRALYNCVNLEKISGRLSFSVANCQNLRNLKAIVLNGSVVKANFTNLYSLQKVSFPKNFTATQTNWQNTYNLENVTLSALTASCFTSSGIKSVTLINVEEIPNNAFYQCVSLKRVYVPKTVTSIGSQAFGYCYTLYVVDFTSHDTIPTLSSINAFSGINDAYLQIRVPLALVDEWKSATNWSTYANNIVGV